MTTRGNTSEAINLSRLLSALILSCWIILTVGWEANLGMINFQFTGLWKMSNSNFFDWAINFSIFSAPFVIVILIWHNLYRIKNKKLIGKLVYVTQHVTIAMCVFVYCLIAIFLANRADEDVFFLTDWIMTSFGKKLLAVLAVVSMFYGLIIVIFPPRNKGGS